MVNPVHHGSTLEEIKIYKVEPYVVAADVYAVSQHTGRGGWTWYTGSAGWLYQLIVDSLLGLQRRADTLQFDPCLPEEWVDVTIRYRFKSSTYVIELIQSEDHPEAIQVMLDEKLQEGNSIVLVDDGMEHQVRVNLKS